MEENKRQPFAQLWESDRAAPQPRDVLRILAISETLPLKYWRYGYFFRGIFDETLYKLTKSRFPAKVLPFKRRPIFCLRVMSYRIGAEVCPCTTKKQGGKVRHIREGCNLHHTGYTIQKDSYILEKIRFKIPVYTAGHLQFLGEVPETCIEKNGARNGRK